MTTSRTFYLASTETIGFEDPREGTVLRELSRPVGSQVILVSLARPIQFNDGTGLAREVGLAILAPRLVGVSVVEPMKWPAPVHVVCPLSEVNLSTFSPSGQWAYDPKYWYHYAWAEMYPTLERAWLKR